MCACEVAHAAMGVRSSHSTCPGLCVMWLWPSHHPNDLPDWFPAGKSASKPSSVAKRQQTKRALQPAAKPKPAAQPAAVAKPQGSFSRKRTLESSSQQMTQQTARPSKQQRPAAEALFDSLFDEEQENGAAAVAPQAQLPAKPALVAAAAGRSSKGEADLAAKVQARLEKHRARYARRRTASQRQLEDEE